MSWSWEISLCFVIFEILSLLYVLRRNLYIDRWFCLILLPFLCQEIIQFFEYAAGDIHNATTTQCTPFNRLLSKCLIFVVYSIPLCVSVFSFATSQYHPKEESVTISWMWKWNMIKDINLFVILCILMMIDNECITVGQGPNSPQQWAQLLTPNIIENGTDYGFTVFFTAIYYYPSFILTATLYKPLWIVFFPMLYTIISFILMRIFLGDEGWSVWCWSSSACFTIWCFVYVVISKWMIKKYAIQQSIDINDEDDDVEDDQNTLIDAVCGDKCVHKRFLEKTQQHFVRYGMMNDDQENKFLENGMVNFKI